jgi:hypothetical protein
VGRCSSKIGERLGCFMSQPRLILGVDSNCFGGREKRPSCVKKLRNRIKPKFSGGYVSKVRRLLNAGEIVVPTFQTSGLADLQGTGNSRLLGATGRRGQPISTVNSLKTARNRICSGHWPAGLSIQHLPPTLQPKFYF